MPFDPEHERAKWRAFPRGRPRQRAEPGPGQESVGDYPRPPRLEAVREPLRVELGGRTIAATERALRVCETASPPTYYFPPEDVSIELVPSDTKTFCEWKGMASYWSLRHPETGALVRDVAWSYPEPDREFAALRDYRAFYAGRVDACFVGDDRVDPQAGSFYGGWVTAKIVGPFKGDPGTEGW